MSNYNDGKWHGWNGGKCPVHPKTKVEVALPAGRGFGGVFPAEGLWWERVGSTHSIVAFRVVEEYKEPREFWINENPRSLGGPYESKEAADFNAIPQRVRCIHVREVLE